MNRTKEVINCLQDLYHKGILSLSFELGKEGTLSLRKVSSENGATPSTDEESFLADYFLDKVVPNSDLKAGEVLKIWTLNCSWEFISYDCQKVFLQRNQNLLKRVADMNSLEYCEQNCFLRTLCDYGFPIVMYIDEERTLIMETNDKGDRYLCVKGFNSENKEPRDGFPKYWEIQIRYQTHGKNIKTSKSIALVALELAKWLESHGVEKKPSVPRQKEEPPFIDDTCLWD